VICACTTIRRWRLPQLVGPSSPYVLDDTLPGGQRSAAARWWLHQSLTALDSDLCRRGSRLILWRGPAGEEIARMVSETGSDAVFWNRCYPDWASGLRATWRCGEAAVLRSLAEFLDNRLASYVTRRDRPGIAGTSRLSPHLAWGEIGPRQVWHATIAAAHAAGGTLDAASETFLSELGWREFCWHLAFQNRDLSTVNFRRAFDRFPRRQGFRTHFARGEPATPAIPSSMPACASCGRPDGCTIACA
jgi:deoxyribodipyrimidine photolyase